MRIKFTRFFPNEKTKLVFRNVVWTLESDKHAVDSHVAPSFPRNPIANKRNVRHIFQLVSQHTKWIASSIFLYDLSLSHHHFTTNARMFYLFNFGSAFLDFCVLSHRLFAERFLHFLVIFTIPVSFLTEMILWRDDKFDWANKGYLLHTHALHDFVSVEWVSSFSICFAYMQRCRL